MDQFSIESSPQDGEIVSMAKRLPRVAVLSSREVARIAVELARHAPQGLLEELRQQNQELLSTLQELRDRQAEIASMHTSELDETNRGVVALYAELDDSAKSLKRLSDLKSRFLSEMSHEFRSPLNSIKSLTRFLLERSDGELSAEQDKQVRFIRHAAEGLSTLVDDLLDLAKVEAGKAVVRIGTFDVHNLLESLEGTIRPMIARTAVSLVFVEPKGIPALITDEGKIAQILRNFLTNAVKFTERGEIRVTAELGPDDAVTFSVRDTGIGIAVADLSRIFEDYGQVDNRLQSRNKGIGLGLPLTRKLAQLLGGSVSVSSELGTGSTFFAVIPRVYHPTTDDDTRLVALFTLDQKTKPGKALIVDDSESDRNLLKETLAALDDFDIIEAENGEDAITAARAQQPDVVFLDLLLPDMSGFAILDRLKSDVETKRIPVIIDTSRTLDHDQHRRLAESAVAILLKGSESYEERIAQVRDSLQKAGLNPSRRAAEE